MALRPFFFTDAVQLLTEHLLQKPVAIVQISWWGVGPTEAALFPYGTARLANTLSVLAA